MTPSASPPSVPVEHLGRMPYAEALAIQHDRERRVLDGERDGFLLTVEHEPVLTVARRAAPGDLGLSAKVWRARGVDIQETNRGGKVTYHGPGQLVAYPILALRRIGLDVTDHVRSLEETAIRLLRTYDIEGRRDPENPGVWVDTDARTPLKVAALGVHVKRWITTHGIAVNVDLDTSIYDLFNPCGLGGERGVTSIAKLTGAPVDLDDARARFLNAFEEVYPVRLER